MAHRCVGRLVGVDLKPLGEDAYHAAGQGKVQEQAEDYIDISTDLTPIFKRCASILSMTC